MSDTTVTESIDEEIEVLDDRIEVVEEELDEIEGELAEDRERRERSRLVVITVDNRDDGLTIRLRAPQGKHVSALINPARPTSRRSSTRTARAPSPPRSCCRGCFPWSLTPA